MAGEMFELVIDRCCRAVGLTPQCAQPPGGHAEQGAKPTPDPRVWDGEEDGHSVHVHVKLVVRTAL